MKLEEGKNEAASTIAIDIEDKTSTEQGKEGVTTLELGYIKRTKRGFTVWPIQYMTKEEMEATLNDPDQRDKAEYSTVREHHTLTKKEETMSAKAENKQTQNNVLEKIYLAALSDPYKDDSDEEEPDPQPEPYNPMTIFQNHMKKIRKRAKIREEATRFYCPDPCCMWRRKEKKEDEEEDEEIEEPDQYEWPCLKCEINMTGDSNTPHIPFGYRYLSEEERREKRKREMKEDKDDNTENFLWNKRCHQDIESRGKKGKKWIHKELTKEEGPKLDITREWTPGYYPEKEKECQACGFPNINMEYGKKV